MDIVERLLVKWSAMGDMANEERTEAADEIEKLRKQRNWFEHALWSIAMLEEHDEGTVLWWCIFKARAALKGDK